MRRPGSSDTAVYSLAIHSEMTFARAPVGLRPFFRYFGSKWRISKYYPAPRYNTIVEPFAGSAGYSTRYAYLDVVLCDVDPIIVAVWQYLIRVKPEEILSLPDLPPDGAVGELNIIQEAKWLIGFWIHPGAVCPQEKSSLWVRDNINTGFWRERLRRRIASQLQFIRHWKIHHCSYDECPLDGPATWFIDPPYYGLGKYYRNGARHIDYAALGEWCRTREGQVIVCENAGADWLPFRELGKSQSFWNRDGAREVVWLNDYEHVECKESRQPPTRRSNAGSASNEKV